MMVAFTSAYRSEFKCHLSKYARTRPTSVHFPQSACRAVLMSRFSDAGEAVDARRPASQMASICMSTLPM